MSVDEETVASRRSLTIWLSATRVCVCRTLSFVITALWVTVEVITRAKAVDRIESSTIVTSSSGTVNPASLLRPGPHQQLPSWETVTFVVLPEVIVTLLSLPPPLATVAVYGLSRPGRSRT